MVACWSVRQDSHGSVVPSGSGLCLAIHERSIMWMIKYLWQDPLHGPVYLTAKYCVYKHSVCILPVAIVQSIVSIVYCAIALG